MSSISNVGEILDPRSKTYVEWKIPNYFSLTQKADVCFESPPFCFCNAQWFIKLYPNGSRDIYSVGWIDLYLYVHNPVSSHSVKFKLGIKYLGKEIYRDLPRFITFGSGTNSYGFPKICKRNSLLRLMRDFSPEGTLIVYCHAIAASTTVKDAAIQTAPDSIAVLCRDFQDLLQSERKSDVTIEVCGTHVFQAHKLILESRSPVFSAMFDHNMTEKNDRIVKISDCDPNAFQVFLQYMYTGKLEVLSWDNVIHLFTIADKYCMNELMEQCSEYMIENLSVDSACDVLVVADRHNEMELKDYAKILLTKNMTTFKTTDKWKSFMSVHPLLAAEILLKFVPDEYDFEDFKSVRYDADVY